jgi:ABC-2 type transport system permease protein
MAGVGGVWTLASHQLRGRLRQIIIWGVVLGALGALYVALFPSMGSLLEEYMTEAPETMQQYIGSTGGELTIEQWLDMEFFSGIIPLALPFFMMVIGAKAIAGSEERKTLDLLLSNPVPRWQVVAGALLTMALALAGVLAITWLLTYIAVPAAGVDLSPGRLAQGLVTLWPFCLFFGSLALLASALVRRGALAIVIPGVILVGMYVIDALGQVSKTVEPLRALTLQHHLGGSLASDFPWTALLVTLLVVCALGAAAATAFARRDIYT